MSTRAPEDKFIRPMSCDSLLVAAAELRQALLELDAAIKRRAAAKLAYDEAVVAALLGRISR